jgi:peptidoglycan/xylan/chitin deacetylase (PgdA/CDA1 family)
MYHYVRPIAGSRFPGIKGLEVIDFEEQVAYLLRHHNVVSLRDIVDATHRGIALPENPAVLTFDDGYSDHYRYVLPILRRFRITGAFFPPSCAVMERRVLDVNKIHFLLCTLSDTGRLLAEMEDRVEAMRSDPGLESMAAYRQKYRHATRLDTADTIYIKRMLQTGLPPEVRSAIVDDLFRGFVSADPRGFADDLYMSIENLREMAESGMEIGSHGHDHQWLNSLDRQEQASDIERSLEMLDRIGLKRRGFLFCYPYGAYNSDTLRALSDLDCAAAVTTKVGLAYPAPEAMLQLPRLDTVDLPRQSTAEICSWTQMALAEAQPDTQR